MLVCPAAVAEQLGLYTVCDSVNIHGIPTYFTFYHAIHQASRNNLVLEQLNYLKEKFAQAWYYAGVEFDDYRCQCREIILAMAADEPEEAIRIAGLEQDNFQALLRKYLF